MPIFPLQSGSKHGGGQRTACTPLSLHQGGGGHQTSASMRRRNVLTAVVVLLAPSPAQGWTTAPAQPPKRGREAHPAAHLGGVATPRGVKESHPVCPNAPLTNSGAPSHCGRAGRRLDCLTCTSLGELSVVVYLCSQASIPVCDDLLPLLYYLPKE